MVKVITRQDVDMTATSAVCFLSVFIRSKPRIFILTCTESMVMACTTKLLTARHRPACKIIAVTPHEETIRRMQLCWGVES